MELKGSKFRSGRWQRIVRIILGGLILSPLTVGASGVWEHKGEGDYVVVLHGMGRTRLAMLPLCRALNKKGYHVINVGYPSLRYRVDDLERGYVRPAVDRYCPDPQKRIHFIGHSLGNILIRHYLSGSGRPERLGRVVMLAPPNRGSEIIDKVGNWHLSRIVLGPASLELGTGRESVPNRLGPADYPVAVVMGDKSSIPFFRKLFPGRSDGIVSVERGKLDGMEAFEVCHASHTFIMNNRKAREAAIRYLGARSLSEGFRK